MIIQEAGNGTSFNYTTAAGVYLAIATVGGDNTEIHIQTFTPSASGVGYALKNQGKTFGGNFIIGNGQIIGRNLTAVVDSNGIYLAGIEI